MKDASRSKQNDVMLKQMLNFETLLKHGRSRFNRALHHDMLKSLAKIRRQSVPGRNRTEKEIQSVDEIHRILAFLKDNSSDTESDREVYNYFVKFLKDLQYTTDLKKIFDETIYSLLYEFFYDPIDSATELLSDDEDEETTENGNYSDSESDTRTFSPYGNAKRILIGFDTPKARLAQVVNDLFLINQNWHNLITDGPLNENDFEIDSAEEISKKLTTEGFHLLLRLFPDLLLKSEKSLNLAKEWWVNGGRIYTSRPLLTSAKIHAEIDRLHRAIGGLDKEIKEEESSLYVHEKDLRSLSAREDRFLELSEKCEKAEAAKNDAGEKYNAAILKKEQTARKLEKVKEKSIMFKQLNSRHTTHTNEVHRYENELRLTEYNFKILQNDFSVELELRPSFILIAGDITCRIQELESSLAFKKLKRKRYEERLQSIEGNIDKMHKIMDNLGNSPRDVCENLSDLKKRELQRGKARKRGSRSNILRTRGFQSRNSRGSLADSSIGGATAESVISYDPGHDGDTEQSDDEIDDTQYADSQTETQPIKNNKTDPNYTKEKEYVKRRPSRIPRRASSSSVIVNSEKQLHQNGFRKSKFKPNGDSRLNGSGKAIEKQMKQPSQIPRWNKS